MKIRIQLPYLALIVGLSGVGFAVCPSAPVWAAPKKAPCAVCAVREGAGPEPVKATAVHQGKEYSFCSDKCRVEFLKDPAEFLQTQAPKAAPSFNLKSLAGETVGLTGLKGKVVLVDFWATFCAPCVKAMPKLQKLHDRLSSRNFTVVGIATDEEGEKKVGPVVARMKIGYPILIDTASVWKAYGVETLPALFLIDRTGRIVKRFGGGVEHRMIEAEVEKLVLEGVQ